MPVPRRPLARSSAASSALRSKSLRTIERSSIAPQLVRLHRRGHVDDRPRDRCARDAVDHGDVGRLQPSASREFSGLGAGHVRRAESSRGPVRCSEHVDPRAPAPSDGSAPPIRMASAAARNSPAGRDSLSTRRHRREAETAAASRRRRADHPVRDPSGEQLSPGSRRRAGAPPAPRSPDPGCRGAAYCTLGFEFRRHRARMAGGRARGGCQSYERTEREGFEPSKELLAPYSLSRRVPSATRPPLPVKLLSIVCSVPGFALLPLS